MFNEPADYAIMRMAVSLFVLDIGLRLAGHISGEVDTCTGHNPHSAGRNENRQEAHGFYSLGTWNSMPVVDEE